MTIELSKHELAIVIAFLTRVIDAGHKRPDLLNAEDLAALADATHLAGRLRALATGGRM
jgi:hypothetical protein